MIEKIKRALQAEDKYGELTKLGYKIVYYQELFEPRVEKI